MQYLAKGVLPQKHNERYKFKKLATRYFLYEDILLRRDMIRTHYDVWVPKKWGK